MGWFRILIVYSGKVCVFYFYFSYISDFPPSKMLVRFVISEFFVIYLCLLSSGRFGIYGAFIHLYIGALVEVISEFYL